MALNVTMLSLAMLTTIRIIMGLIMTFSNMTLNVMTLSKIPFKINASLSQNDIKQTDTAEMLHFWQYAECHSAECRSAKCRGATETP